MEARINEEDSQMYIEISSRHKEIIGRFGEYLVCSWLDRSGFEVAWVNHTGLDLVAYYPTTKERLGISVKARSRRKGQEGESVTVFMHPKKDRENLMKACEFFACKPWIAVYVELTDKAHLLLTSLDNYDAKKYGHVTQQAGRDNWSMSRDSLAAYFKDPNVKHIGLRFKSHNWWKQASDLRPIHQTASSIDISSAKEPVLHSRSRYVGYGPSTGCSIARNQGLGICHGIFTIP
jgi:hypothetical protein